MGEWYATEAAIPIVRHAFETLGLNRIVADIDAQNVLSKRGAEKIGMKVVRDVKHDGVPYKTYQIDIDEYKLPQM